MYSSHWLVMNKLARYIVLSCCRFSFNALNCQTWCNFNKTDRNFMLFAMVVNQLQNSLKCNNTYQMIRYRTTLNHSMLCMSNNNKSSFYENKINFIIREVGWSTRLHKKWLYFYILYCLDGHIILLHRQCNNVILQTEAILVSKLVYISDFFSHTVLFFCIVQTIVERK